MFRAAACPVGVSAVAVVPSNFNSQTHKKRNGFLIFFKKFFIA
nr:MAG TPA: hypothetical protein [Caudoviricetes sp.]